ncbi:MAG: hypothetical protein M3Y08_12850 [Fibrobacterota bacterium]|nr:hypothetical protein [Fibrobacterota bacterium]
MQAPLYPDQKVRRPIRNHRLLSLPSISGLALIFSMVLPTYSAENIKLPTGDLRSSILADLKPHPSSSKTYNEFWTYHFVLEGNIQAVLNFSRVNLGSFKSPVCGADLTLLGLKGRNFTVAREYEKKNFVFTDSNQQLRVHEKIWFEGSLPKSHRVHFATTKKSVDYFLDLAFTDILPGKVWGDGMFKFGSSDAVGIFIHIPSAKVSGRLAVNGDTLEVKGTAYMDHTFQTALAPSLVGAGFRYVTRDGPLEVGYFMEPVSRFQKQTIGYGLRQTEGGLTLLKPTGLKVAAYSKAMGVRIPSVLEIHFQAGGKSVLHRGQDRLQQSTLHEFSGFTKMAIKNFMGGEILTFKGLGRLNDSLPMAYNYFSVQ